MRIEISRILHNSIAIAWGNSGSYDFSVNTDYQLIYIKRTLYNIPIGWKIFLRWNKYIHIKIKLQIINMKWICYNVIDLDFSVAGKGEVNTLQYDKFCFQKPYTDFFY